jgi:hypothetical protein
MIYDHDNNGTLTLIEIAGISYLKDILKELNPELIIEFGTYHGGLCKYFISWFPLINIYSFDKKYMISEEDQKLFENSNLTILVTDLFKSNPLISILLALPLRKFLFCDNGDKDFEVRKYSRYLNSGDLLGIHDWDTECRNLHSYPFKEFGFEPLPINQYFNDTPGTSELRFFRRL